MLVAAGIPLPAEPNLTPPSVDRRMPLSVAAKTMEALTGSNANLALPPFGPLMVQRLSPPKRGRAKRAMRTKRPRTEWVMKAVYRDVIRTEAFVIHLLMLW